MQRFLLRVTAMGALVLATTMVPQVVFGQDRAAPDAWVILPITDDASDTLAFELLEPLEAAQVNALDGPGAVMLFEEFLSVSAQRVTQSELDEWADRSRTALRALAQGDYDRARADLLEAQRVSQRAAEEMNREAERAREVLDTCLYMARALVETQQRAAALDQVRMCRVLVPSVEPGGFRHPPEIQALLDRVDAEVSNSTLEVTSEPSGCVVRVNGVQQGETPFVIPNIPRGDYRVQVECSEQRGRVHHARIGQENAEGTLTVHVDVEFDATIHTSPALYASTQFELRGLGRIAQATGRTVVGVRRDGAGYQLWRVDPTPEGERRRNMRVTEIRTSAAHMGDAVVALKAHRSTDLRGETPAPLLPSVIAQGGARLDPDATEVRSPDWNGPARYDGPDPQAGSPGLAGWRLGTGVALLALGAGGIVAGMVLHFDRQNVGSFYGDYTSAGMLGFLENQAAWLNTQLAPTAVLALGGGALMAVGIGLLIPAEPEPAWWTWALGGLGVAVAGASIIPILTRPDCINVAEPMDNQNGMCVEHDMALSQSLLIASAAMPLIAIPISALIQSGSSSADNSQAVLLPTLDIGPTHFSFNLFGTL